MSDKSLHDIANLSINPVWVKADDKLLVPLLERFEKEELGHRVGINTKREFNAEICHNLINFFVKIINEELQNIITLHKRHEQFMRLYGGATSIQDQQQYILRYARDLGATQEQLKQDKKPSSDGLMLMRWLIDIIGRYSFLSAQSYCACSV